MKRLTVIISTVFFPVALFCQTIHVSDDRIVYKGSIPVENARPDELGDRARQSLAAHMKLKPEAINQHGSGLFTAEGSMRLPTPHHIIRRLHYTFELTVANDGYQYRIDSVYLQQKERGEHYVKISSDQMLKGVEVTGPESIVAEKQLNEIDMNFQKLIAMITADLKRAAIAKNSEGR